MQNSCISSKYSRFTEETTNGASNKEEKLLWEEDQSDLLEGGLSLTSQVQNGRTQKSYTEPKTEEHNPVCESMLPVTAEQSPDTFIKQMLHTGESFWGVSSAFAQRNSP